LSTGWGTWGFKAIPIGGKSMAELVATKRIPEILAPLGLNRFRLDRCISERASAGTH
jgi:sarcosine oxidase subunit beta